MSKNIPRDPRSYDWYEPVVSRLDELFDLEKGWDGYGAPAVSTENGAFALSMLKAICGSDAPTPQIVPGANGDLQIEWHLAGTDIELYVRRPNDVHAWRKLDARPGADELVLSDDFSTVSRWIRELSVAVCDASITAA